MHHSDTTRSQTQCPINNTNTTLFVFFSMYRSDATCSQTQCRTNNTSVCINPEMTLYVFFSIMNPTSKTI